MRQCIVVLLICVIEICLINAAYAKEQSSPMASQLSNIEQRLFFREYSDEDEVSRISRIEKEVFGQPQSGEITQRMANLRAALPAVPDKESSTGSGSNGPARQQTPPVTKSPATPTASSSWSSASPSDDKADDNDQEKLSVLAAKQKEIDDLLAQGVALWKARKAELALDKFSQVVRLDPQNAQALFSMGVVFEAQGDVLQAKNSYQQAHMLEPDNKDYTVALAAIDKKVVVKEKSNQEQSQLRQLADDAASAYQRGEYLSALDLYKQLDQQAPNQAIVKWNIGSLYLMNKNPQKALQYYKEACKLKPDEERYKLALKQLEQNVKEEQIKQKEADNAWQKAAETGNNQSDLKQSKGQAGNGAKSKNKAKEANVLLYYGIAAKHNKEGAKIVRIEPGSRAAQVGLKVDDLIMAVDGSVTTDGEEVNRILLSKPPGARFQFTVQRGTRMGPILF